MFKTTNDNIPGNGRIRVKTQNFEKQKSFITLEFQNTFFILSTLKKMFFEILK